MGCDIHIVLEEKDDGGRWIGINTFTSHERARREDGRIFPVATARNYARFAALAGVRGDGPPYRGVPLDASDTAKFLIDKMGSDGHSHSWLSLADAISVFVDTEEWQGNDQPGDRNHPGYFFFGVGWWQHGELFRIIFWFDN